MSVPVVVSKNGYGVPVRVVDSNAPVMHISDFGSGAPIILHPNGAPFILNGPEFSLPYAPSFDLDLSAGRGYAPYEIFITEPQIKSLFSTWSTPAHFAEGKNGVLYSVAANAIDCFHLPPGQCRGQLIEGARTNLLLRSFDLGNASWSTLRAGKSGGAPFAEEYDYTQVAASETNGSGAFVSQTLNSIGAGTYGFSVFVAAQPSADGFLILRPMNLGDFVDYAFVGVNPETGAIVSQTSTLSFSLVSAQTRAVAGGWRVEMVFTTSQTLNIACRFYVSDAGNNLGTTNGKKIQVTAAQFEAGPSCSSPIVTEGSQETRAASSVIGDVSGMWADNGEGSLYAQFETPVSGLGSARRIVEIDNGSVYERLGITTTDSFQAAYTPDGSVNAGTLSADTAYRLAARFAENDLAFYRNGASLGSDSSVTLSSGFDRIAYGMTASGSNHLHGYLARVALWKRQLSNAELEGVTS